MTLQQKILAELKTKPDTFVFKTIQCNVRGIPDIIVCHKGTFIAIEVKDGKDKLSEIQKEQLLRIEAAGGTAWTCYNIMEFRMYWLTLGTN